MYSSFTGSAGSTFGGTKTVGSGYNQRTVYMGPAGTSTRGNQGRKKSLGLQALEQTYQGAGIVNAKGLTGGNIGKHQGIGAEVRNARIAQAQKLMDANKPPENVSSDADEPKDNIAGRDFNLTRQNKEIGIGGPKIIKSPFNRKNPNQREINPLGGPVRL